MVFFHVWNQGGTVRKVTGRWEEARQGNLYD